MIAVLTKNKEDCLRDCKVIPKVIGDCLVSIELKFIGSARNFETVEFENQKDNELFIWNCLLYTFGYWCGYYNIGQLDLFSNVEEFYIEVTRN